MARGLGFVVALVLLASIGCAGPAPAPPTEPAPRASRSVRDTIALAVLRGASMFTDASVGEDGDTPWQNHALAMLVASRDAAGLRELLDVDEPAVQLFALVGLAEVDSATFAAALPALRLQEDPVRRMSGCIIYATPIAEAAHQIEDGRAREGVLPVWTTPDPYHVEDGRTPEQWVERLAWARALPESRDALWRCGRHALPALIAGLAHANVRVRRAAAWRLHDLGPRALEAVGPLARALEHDPDPETRRIVAAALAELGPWALDAAPALLRAVAPEADPWLFQPEAQLDAIDALSSIARYSPGAVDVSARTAATVRPIERALDDPSEWVRERALEELWSLPPTREVGRLVARRAEVLRTSDERASWLERARENMLGHAVLDLARAALLDAEPSLQRAAVDILIDAGERARVDAALAEVRAGRDDDPRAIVLAARLDRSRAPAELVAALRPGTPWVVVDTACEAAGSAETIGVDALLIATLKGSDSMLRHAARRALNGTRPWPDLISAHANRLDDLDPITRVTAAEIVLLLESRQRPVLHSPRAREVLAAALADTTDLAVRRRALETLRRPHPRAGATLQDLTDPALPPWTRLELSRAALGWYPKDMTVLLTARSALAELVSVETDPSLRREAIAALANDGVAATCRKFEDDPDPIVGLYAAMGSVLGGDATPELVAHVMAALPTSSDRLRAWVVDRLAWLARDLRRADPDPALVESLTEAFLAALEDPELVEDAVSGLDANGLDVLVRGLDQARSPRAVAALADALGRVVVHGLEPRPAVEALERALARERDPRLRYLITLARERPREVE